jgi:hypothetical protein
MTTETPSRRLRWLSFLIGAPVLLVAVGIGVVEAWRLVQPDSRWFVTPPSFSFAEAVTTGDTQTMYELLLAGHDANELITVREPGVTDSAPLVVRPLLWAVAHERYGIALMLHEFGARLESGSQRLAVCFVRQRGNDVVARILAGKGGVVVAECPSDVSPRDLLLTSQAADGGSASSLDSLGPP